jgi:DNA-binding NarL/FixJ family response regulator
VGSSALLAAAHASHALEVHVDCVLIAEDNPVVASSLARSLGRRIPVAVARSFVEARALLAGPTMWLGGVFDVSLPDGSGLDLLDAFRAVESSAPALVLTGHCDAALINRAQRRSAEYAVKPAAPSNIRAFADRAVAHRDRREREIEVLVAGCSDHYGLSPSERKILAASARGAARKQLADDLGVSENTIKMQVKSLLRKCDDAESLGDIVREIWRRSTGS